MAIFPAASNLVPIHRLYHPLLSLSPSLHLLAARFVLVQPRPSSIAPLFLLRVEEGRLRAETARGVGVVPGASHQRRRPTDRPTVPTERSPLSQASIKPGAVERVVPPSAVGAHATLFPSPCTTHRTQPTTHVPVTSRAGVTAVARAVHGGLWLLTNSRVGREKWGVRRATRAGSIAK